MAKHSCRVMFVPLLLCALALCADAEAQTIIFESFHACCEREVLLLDDARQTNEPSCNRGRKVLDASCNGACCFALALVDPCPGIIGCPGDDCPVQFERPEAECADTDGDGLLDSWETGAVTGVGLPSVADPLHKDVFIEMDYMSTVGLTQGAVRELKRAFCAAPPDAGGTNTGDGIRVWVDTGDLTDPMGRETPIRPCSCGDGTDNDGDGTTDGDDSDCLDFAPYASEDGAGAGSCNDGADNGADGVDDETDPDCLVFDESRSETNMAMGSCLNGIDEDGDGLFDTTDPDCFVGDDFGGGESVMPAGVAGINNAFYAIKTANFDTGREKVFRYSLAARMPRSNSGLSTGGNTATTLNDTGKSWTSDGWQSRTVDILSGRGAGQSAVVSGNSGTQLVVGGEEDQAGPGSCNDGADNAGDGQMDGADTDCQGWSVIPDETSAYEIKLVGGQGELGGNDFIVFGSTLSSVDPAAIMHELGHTMKLDHGGDAEDNCKPSYSSVMNYNLAYGIPQASPLSGQDLSGDGMPDGLIIDFSPPRFPSHSGLSRGVAPLPSLIESNLAEASVLDASDPSTQLVFTDATGASVQSPHNGDVDLDGMPDGVDWLGDGDWDDGPGLMVNINTSGASGSPAACTNDDILSAPLTGYDDWRNISLPFGHFGNDTDAPVNPVLTPEPTSEELLQLRVAINTTDLSVSQSASPDPVEVGDPLFYSIAGVNLGPNPAGETSLAVALPMLASYLSHDSSALQCVHSAGSLLCEGGQLRPRVGLGVELVVDTSDVCVNGLPTPLTSTVTLDNVLALAGSDVNPSDNSATLVTTTVDTTPPVIENLTADPSSLWPPNHKFVEVTLDASVTDICDDNPSCAVASVSSDEAVQGKGSGNTETDWIIEGPNTVSLRAERSGKGSGRRYTLTYECSDASGNTASATTSVTVAHNR